MKGVSIKMKDKSYLVLSVVFIGLAGFIVWIIISIILPIIGG